MKREHDDSAPRRKATQRQAKNGARRRNALIPALVALGLLAGAASGALAVWRAHHAADPVALVNGVPIERELLRGRLTMTTNKPALVDLMVEDEQAVQFARKTGVTPSNQDIDDLTAQEMRQPEFARSVALSGKTVADVRRDALISLTRTNSVVKGVTVSEAEIRHFYDVNADAKNPAAEFYTPEKLQVALIVTRAREEAQGALSELSRGTAFAIVASRHSVDTSKVRGGLLPVIVRGRPSSAKAAGLEDRLFAMQDREVAGPLHVGQMWWIVRRVSATPASVKRFENVRSECEVKAKLSKMGPAKIAAVEKSFDEFKKQTRVIAWQPEYKLMLHQ